MRIIFLGTPEYAIPSLQALINDEVIEVMAVVTQPDKPVGRKKIITPPPVKVLAEGNSIPVYQPKKIREDRELIEKIIELKPDAMVTCAFGQILSQEVLDLAPKGVINVHASLLPKYRGPAPINWMIINGEEVVGVTTMMTELGVDEGDMLLKYETQLEENETAEKLSTRLSEASAALLVKTLKELDQIKPEKQIYPKVHNKDTDLAPFMDRRLGEVDFKSPELVYGSANPRQADWKISKKSSAQNIHNLVRGTYPWPGAYFMHIDHKVILLETRVHEQGDHEQLEPGQLVQIGIDEDPESCLIQTHDGLLEILKLKPQGKSEMTAKAWLNGTHLEIGDPL